VLSLAPLKPGLGCFTRARARDEAVLVELARAAMLILPRRRWAVFEAGEALGTQHSNQYHTTPHTTPHTHTHLADLPTSHILLVPA